MMTADTDSTILPFKSPLLLLRHDTVWSSASSRRPMLPQCGNKRAMMLSYRPIPRGTNSWPPPRFLRSQRKNRNERRILPPRDCSIARCRVTSISNAARTSQPARRLRMNVMVPLSAAAVGAILGLLGVGGSAASAQECKHRGQLDTLYCDENQDLVADTPTDPKKWKDPATLVFTYTP